MAAIRTKASRNMEPSMSEPEPSFRNEEIAFEMLVIYEGDKLQMEYKDMRRTYVEKQRIIEAALHEIQESTLDRRIEATADTKVFSLLETSNKDAEKVRKDPCLPSCGKERTLSSWPRRSQ